jgi:signal peptidase II
MKTITPNVAYLVAAGVFALDRLTKWVIESTMTTFDVQPVIPGFFDIVHARNRGAAFSILANSDSIWRDVLLIGISAAALLIVGSMLRNATQLDRRTAIALSLILGGAIGNVFDRVMFGAVTDFLDFYIGDLHWPAFNVADSAIVIGSGLLLLGMWRKQEPART